MPSLDSKEAGTGSSAPRSSHLPPRCKSSRKKPQRSPAKRPKEVEFEVPRAPVDGHPAMLGAATHLGGVKEHLVVHLDLPEQPRDLGVGHGREHHVVDPEKRHQHQRGPEQFPGRRDLGDLPGALGSPFPQCPGWRGKSSDIQSQPLIQQSCHCPATLPHSSSPPHSSAPPPRALGAVLAQQAAGRGALGLAALACTAAAGPACPWCSPRAWRPKPGRC